MRKEYYYSVDILKIVCSVMIVCIHTSPLSSFDGIINSFIVNCVCRVAVPFFFVSSGFLLFGKAGLEPVKGVIIGYLKRMLLLYIFWSAVYFPLTAARMYYSGSPCEAVKVFLGWLKNMIFSAGYGFLWYLPASIVAVAIVSFMLKRKISLNAIIAFGAVLYAVGLCGQAYFGLVRQIPHPAFIGAFVKGVHSLMGTTRNGVFEGVIFIALGARLSQKQDYGKPRNSLLLLAVGFILLVAEFFIVSKMGWRLKFDMYLMLVPCAYYLLKSALCIESGIKTDRKPLWVKKLRSYSSLIYFTHMIFVDGYLILNLTEHINSLLMFAMVLVSSIVLSTVILKISETKAFGFVKKLY